MDFPTTSILPFSLFWNPYRSLVQQPRYMIPLHLQQQYPRLRLLPVDYDLFDDLEICFYASVNRHAKRQDNHPYPPRRHPRLQQR